MKQLYHKPNPGLVFSKSVVDTLFLLKGQNGNILLFVGQAVSAAIIVHLTAAAERITEIIHK